MKNGKKILSVLLAVLMFMSIVPMSDVCIGAQAIDVGVIVADAGGKCGENVNWAYYDSNYTIEIHGTGDMYDYESGDSVLSEYPAEAMKVRKIHINEGVTHIGNYAFSYCYNLTNIIDWDDSLISIGDYAFAYCAGINQITIPKNLKSIGNFVFFRCTGLESIDATKARYYTNDDYGVLFDKNKTTLIQYPIGNERTSYVIPDGVMNVGTGSFAYCENLTNVTIPYGVLHIDESAFSNCTGLTRISIPVSTISIGDSAFKQCKNLTNVLIPDSVTYIGEYAFGYCNLQNITIPDSVTSIEKGTFSNCANLTSITIPNSILNIGDYAFNECTNLTDVYFNGTKDQWEVISIGYKNDPLFNATIHFEGCTHENTTTHEQQDATCTEDGYTDGEYCTDCETWISGHEKIPATNPEGHTYSSTITKAPTHLEAGIETFTCVCGDSYTKTIAKIEGHTYNKIITVPTCTKKGYTTYTCDCGDSYISDYINMIDHSYTSKVTTVATCKSEGVKTYTCSECSYSYTETIAKNASNHTGGTEIKNAKSATCTAEGYTGDTYCKTCGVKTKSGTVIAKTAHNSNTTIPAVAATCTKTGLTEGKKCSVCGTVTVAQQTVAKTAHSYTSKVTTAATCKAEGVKTYTCTACSASYTETIAKNASNHTGGTEIKNAKSATCTAEGYTGDTYCKGCGAKTKSGTAIAKLAHKYTSETVKQPTCNEKGLEIFSCKCGDSYTKEIKATGHSYGDDGICKDCDDYNAEADKSNESDSGKNCSHICHKTGSMGFIWKILRFIFKLFKISPVCDCGVAHY